MIQNERSIHLNDSAVIKYAREHANLIITPHIGGATYDLMASTEIFMAKKLKKYIAGYGRLTANAFLDCRIWINWQASF